MSKSKLLFVYDHPRPERWMDGLWAALNLLEQDFDITKWNCAEYGDSNPGAHPDFDFVLAWGAFHSNPDYMVHKKGLFPNAKKGLCIAGNATPPLLMDDYDVLFYETKWYRNNSDIKLHPNIHHAFGVNTDIFSPAPIPTPILFDYIGVGALALWKRWGMMRQKPGSKLVIGQYQEDNPTESLAIADVLLRGNVMVSNEIPPLDLANYYRWSRTLYMPSDINGGGERAVLEARACGLQVQIEDDNPKLKELVELIVVPNHHYYAAQLKKGIMSAL